LTDDNLSNDSITLRCRALQDMRRTGGICKKPSRSWLRIQ